MIGQLRQLNQGELETWLLCAAAVLGVLVMVKSVFFSGRKADFVTLDEFRTFRASVRDDLDGLRERIDARHLAVLQSVEGLKSAVLMDGERRSGEVMSRLAVLEAAVARLDERTHKA
jgi:hypothetical protein